MNLEPLVETLLPFLIVAALSLYGLAGVVFGRTPDPQLYP